MIVVSAGRQGGGMSPDDYAAVLERAADELDMLPDTHYVSTRAHGQRLMSDAIDLRALAKAMREATPMGQSTLQDLLSDRILITLPEAP